MNVHRVGEIWRRLLPEKYWVDADLIEFNTVSSGLFVESASHVADDGFILVKRGAAGVIHVSAMAAAGFGACERLMTFFRASMLDSGLDFTIIQFGGDRRHFFPGLPSECDALASDLARLGFTKGGSLFDVERDLKDYAPPVEPCADVRECVPGDSRAVSAFLLREFPGRWHDDVMEKFGEDPARVYVLHLAGAIEGFAMTQMDGDVHRRAGAVWSASLGPAWAALGPIGVSKAVRGQGHGHALLAAALCSLRDQGARQTIIDWTTLTGFYGRHGFKPTREYRSFTAEV